MLEKLEVLKYRGDSEFYILIVPNGEHRDFLMCNDTFGNVLYMFSCKVENDDMAIELAMNNNDDYIELYINEFVELSEDDDYADDI